MERACGRGAEGCGQSGDGDADKGRGGGGGWGLGWVGVGWGFEFLFFGRNINTASPPWQWRGRADRGARARGAPNLRAWRTCRERRGTRPVGRSAECRRDGRQGRGMLRVARTLPLRFLSRLRARRRSRRASTPAPGAACAGATPSAAAGGEMCVRFVRGWGEMRVRFVRGWGEMRVRCVPEQGGGTRGRAGPALARSQSRRLPAGPRPPALGREGVSECTVGTRVGATVGREGGSVQ